MIVHARSADVVSAGYFALVGTRPGLRDKLAIV